MKKLLLCTMVMAMFSFSVPADTISKKEKKEAARFLKQTKKEVEAAVKGLSEAQLKFKPSPDVWSVEECLKHIAITEQALWGMTDAALKQPATPEKRSEVKWTDDDVMKKIADRSNKVKTFDPMKPENTPFKSAAEALESFKQNRDKLIGYIKGTDADLRNHVITMPFTSFDGYQMILFISAHSNRHMQQIMEVKANPGFPKN
ncbi:MAG: DinB family protein [Chitinophagaceae bacterium]|nr:DinB family protein [Chitinophagaceae bacterium]